MPVCTFDKLERHGGSSANGVKISAGGTESTFTAEGDVYNMATMFTAVDGKAIFKIAAAEHFVDILKNGIPNMDTG